MPLFATSSPIGRPAIRCSSCGGLNGFAAPDGQLGCRDCSDPPDGSTLLTAVRSGGRSRWAVLRADKPESPAPASASATTKPGQRAASTFVYVSSRLNHFTCPANPDLPADFHCPDFTDPDAPGEPFRRADVDWLTYLAQRIRPALKKLPPDRSAALLSRWLLILNVTAEHQLITFSDFCQLSDPFSLNRKLPSIYTAP